MVNKQPPKVRAARRAAEPRARDADRSQRDILDAARDEFALHGLGGARMDRIAERAEVNKRLIYYYFEGKERLFLAVLERVYEDIRSAEQQLELTQVEPTEAIGPTTGGSGNDCQAPSARRRCDFAKKSARPTQKVPLLSKKSATGIVFFGVSFCSSKAPSLRGDKTLFARRTFFSIKDTTRM